MLVVSERYPGLPADIDCFARSTDDGSRSTAVGFCACWQRLADLPGWTFVIYLHTVVGRGWTFYAPVHARCV